jgi:hypothetical protein
VDYLEEVQQQPKNIDKRKSIDYILIMWNLVMIKRGKRNLKTA